MSRLVPVGGSTPSLVVTPAVAAHRGASGYRPEHTLEAYRTAIRMGVDEIEVDVVPTGDGALIARHENELSRSTDIAQRAALAPLRRTQVVDGVAQSGWFSEDLTLAQVRALTARETLPSLRAHNAAHDQEPVPTLDEVLTLVRSEARRRGRAVGVLIEIKHAAHFARRGLPVEELLASTLSRHRLDHARSRVSVMSFEPGVLRRFARRSAVPVVQLLDHPDRRPADFAGAGDRRTFADLASPEGLAGIREYADGVGAVKDLVLPGRGRGSRLVQEAHRLWLTVHVWTLRAENRFLAAQLRSSARPEEFGDLMTETRWLLDAGVDGLITDHPDLVLSARRGWLSQRPAAADRAQPSGSRIQASR